MKLFNKIQLSVSPDKNVAFAQVLFDASASPADANDTVISLLNEKKIDGSFQPMHGLKVEDVPVQGGRIWRKAVINLRSDDAELVARLRADASVRKMTPLESATEAPAHQ